MTSRLPSLPWPPFDAEVRDAVSGVIADGSWASYSGAATENLQASLRSFFDCTFARLCSSGTIGIEIALHGVGVGAQDEVILAGYDFPGNFRAVENVGAVPVLVDCLEDAHVLDADQVASAVGTSTRAIIASHLHGHIAPLGVLVELCRAHGIALIEDACQVPGARWNGRRLGTVGDVGVISFGGSKLLTAGRGGAMLTQDATIAQRMQIYCERGNDAFPMSQLQAAALTPQVAKLDPRNAIRQERVRGFIHKLRGVGGLRCTLDPRIESAFYKVPLLLEDASASRDAFIAWSNEEGIDLGESFRGFGLRSPRRCRKIGDLPNSRSLSQRTCLLHHPVFLAAEPVVDELCRRLANIAIRSRKTV